MRSRFLLYPAALIACTPAQAYQAMTFEEAQKVLFPGATFTPQTLHLDQKQIGVLMRETGFPTAFYDDVIRAWKVSNGGWLFLDHTLAHNAPITYALGIDADGTVKGVEILDCLPAYDAVQNPKWLGRFVGKRYSLTANPVADIPNISGASLSVEQISTGVRRLIAAHALFFASPG